MALEYDFREKPDPNKSEEKQPLFPRVVVKGTMTSEKMSKVMARRTTFSEAEIRGIIDLFSEEMAYYISEGYTVELGDVGYFTASLTARPVMSKKELRAASVSVKGVKFRLAKAFKNKLRTTTIVRARYGFKKSDKLPPEKRKELLDNYLKKNGFIQRKTYSEITGLLKDLALKDLNNWVKEGYLESDGRTGAKIYLPVRNAGKESEEG